MEHESNAANTAITSISEKLTERHNDNLHFFKKNLPTIFKKIIESKESPKLIIDPSGRYIQRIKDGKPCYEPNAIEYATKEVEVFKSILDKIDYRPNFGYDYLPHLIERKAFKQTIKAYLNDKENSEKRFNTNLDLVIFGCGLGYHIEILLNIHRFRSVTIIENDIRNFKSTLYTINWKNILTSLPKNRKVTLIINTDKSSETSTEKFLYEVKTETVSLFPSNTLSSIRYTHEVDRQEHQTAKETLAEQTNHFNVLYEKIGPDGQRLLNANENLRLNNPVISFNKSKINTDRNIAIIGAGPSLDIYSEILKENRGKFFIFSAGSSLSSLIDLGIKPDVHIELEYKVLLADLIQHISSKTELGDVKLIATIETHPSITKIFGSCYHFIPETSEIAQSIKPDSVLSAGGVNCVVAALAVANILAPKKTSIYLFGIDFANINGEHHSKTNISMKHNLPENLERLKIDKNKIKDKYKIKIKGVTGDTLLSTQALNSSRIAMNELLVKINREIYNCAYGAILDNTKHITPEALSADLTNIQISNATNNLEIHPNQYDYKSINSFCTQLLEKSLSISNEILSVITKNKLEYEETINLIHQINKEINSLKPLQLKRMTYSINRLPIYLLYLVANFSSEEERINILKLWCKDYKKYLSNVDNQYAKKLKDNQHILNKEWTDMNFV